MTSRPIEPGEITAYGELLGRCFAEEQFSAATVSVLSDPDSRARYLRDDDIAWVKTFAEHGHANVVADLRGLILYEFSGEISNEEIERAAQRALESGCSTLTESEQAIMLQHRTVMEQAIDETWMPELYPQGYAHIFAICVSPEHRGSGVFGQLIDPLVEQCNARQLPLCLEAFAEPLLAVYGSRGFEVARTITTAELGLTQHCMVKFPG